MAEQPRLDMARSQVFGEVAELYDAARPGYADALAEEVLAYAELGDRTAVEIGAGTGKATLPFAALGTPLLCIEPDVRMAEVLRRNTAGFPRVRVQTGRFEDWQPDGRRFGLVYAATSWHWVAPERRWDLVHDALAPGGAVALFWNPHGTRDPRLLAALAEVDRRHGLRQTPHSASASDYGQTPGDWADVLEWPEEQCRRDGRFTDLRAVRYRQERYYDTERYLGLLASVSAYRVLPPERLERTLADTAEVLDAHGGGIAMDQLTDLFLARVR
ncbi:class I SAM-dependent methyltransferase [Kitasatospora sp. NPDC127111]|uniref:class I SAM-dependent methyltransferase n=1 Tax=Kitasatospora sp. NPDC127111 TaxID=3345363 RepID=UPI0036435A94